MPLVLSFKLPTTLPPLTLLAFSPLMSRNISAFFSTCSFARFRTQMECWAPFMKCPRITGCLLGRGETWISMDGWEAAKRGRWCCRKRLDGPGHRQCLGSSRERQRVWVWGCILHALRTTGPIAVMKVESFALEDEGANPILGKRLVLRRYEIYLLGSGLSYSGD